MKILFYLLCVLNLVFLLWQFHAGGYRSSAPRPQTMGVILTVDEYARAQRGAEIAQAIEQTIRQWRQAETENMLANLRRPQWRLQAPLAVPAAKKAAKSRDQGKPIPADGPPAPVLARKCFEAGPFADEAGARKWLAKNVLSGKQILQKERIIASDFQIYYPAAKSPEQSLANKLMLKDKGLQDVWMIPDGDKKGAFSLGVFNEKPRAIVFKNQLAARGIQSEIRQRDKTQPQWFAKVMLDKTTLKQYESTAIALTACSNN